MTNKLSWIVKSLNALVLVSAVLVFTVSGSATALAGRLVGDLAVVFTDRDGQPVEGLHVLLNGLDRRETTDSDGSVYFADVPAGRVSLGLIKPFRIIERDGRVTMAEIALENAGEVTVLASELSLVEATIDATVEVRRPVCNTTVACIATGFTDPVQGIWSVTRAGRRFGPCPCVNSTPDRGGSPCPNTLYVNAGPLPAPGLLWSITTLTCYGPFFDCLPPVHSVDCSVTY